MSNYRYSGLTDHMVFESEAKHGNNSLAPFNVESFSDKLIDNFQDPLIKILLLALFITLLLSYFGYTEWIEGIGIGVAVFLATFVSTYSEYKNESSFQRLQEQASLMLCKVFRNGDLKSMPIGEIVCGDYILVQAGDRIPVDGQIVEGELWVSNQSLNGETQLVCKSVPSDNYQPNTLCFNDPYIVFRDSVVNDGEAVVVANQVGIQTQYGKISDELSHSDSRQSPLQVKLASLAQQISKLGYIGALLIAISFLFKQVVIDHHYNIVKIMLYLKSIEFLVKDLVTALILSIIIVVVAVPEGLPMMIAIVLSLNMRKLLKSNVLVRKLLGIEASGSLNVLLVDKTGTLTKGEPDVHFFISGHLQIYSSLTEIPVPLQRVLDFCIFQSSPSYLTNAGGVLGGNSTDRALMTFICQPSSLKLNSETMPYSNFPLSRNIDMSHIHRNHEMLFNSSYKFGLVDLTISLPAVHLVDSLEYSQYENDLRITIIKGAPEVLLSRCTRCYTSVGSTIPLNSVKPIKDLIHQVSAKGDRIVALATSSMLADFEERKLPQEMTLVGVFAMRDEVRPEAEYAIQLIKQSGIQVVMITGDLEETAISVGKHTGILPSSTPVIQPSHSIPPELQSAINDNNLSEGLLHADQFSRKPKILTSKDLGLMTDEQIMDIFPKISVVARAFPTDKSRLVRIAQRLGYVVGMTGDGVNDAAALKAADVGFGMGSGTEIAKEASDIIILDDNIYSITRAILYGRTIFKSIRKFIVFQSTINLSSTLIVFLGPFLGFDFPLTLIQLLWVNLVMDTLAALAFGGEPALPIYLDEAPIGRDHSIISISMWSSILTNGLFIATVFITFLLNQSTLIRYFVRDTMPSEPALSTALFAFFIFINVFNSFNVRTSNLYLLENISSNLGFVVVIGIIFAVQILFSYVGASFLRTVPLTFLEWNLVIFMSLVIVPFDILRKIFMRFFMEKRSGSFRNIENSIDLKENKIPGADTCYVSPLSQLQSLNVVANRLENPDTKKNK